MTAPRTIVLTGATGYVGGALLPRLLAEGHEVRCLVRRPEAASLPPGARVVGGDVVSGDGLDEALAGADAAYYLVHSMGAGGDFARRDREAAATFGRAARRAGVRRVVYLGGLEGASEHLRSREEVADVLAEHVHEAVHARAAMVIGDGSASFVILAGLVRRLPVMLTPRWLDTRSQPIAIDDVVGALARLATHDPAPAEVELGGRDVLTYREMLARVADLGGRRRPALVPVPVFTPRLSSYWIALMTPVPLGVVKPLVEGLRAETVVRTAPPAGINDAPLGFDDAVRAALGR